MPKRHRPDFRIGHFRFRLLPTPRNGNARVKWHGLRTSLVSLRGHLQGPCEGIAETPERQARYLVDASAKSDELERPDLKRACGAFRRPRRCSCNPRSGQLVVDDPFSITLYYPAR